MTPAQIGDGPRVILCADDYGISPAVSAGIAELAAAGRLSAMSCMVTFGEWPDLAQRALALRPQIAIGLHLNLTVGSPLGPLPHLAPTGQLPTAGGLIGAAARGAIDASEIKAEVVRQLDAFSQAAGFLPDFLDGHQHVHAIAGVRKGVLSALRNLPNGAGLLVRDPSDTLARMTSRKMFLGKALTVSALAAGFAKAVRAAGMTVNEGFSGFSDFDPGSPYARELEAAFTACGPTHLAMCHPGHADAVLAGRDRVTERRQQEWDGLLAAEGLEQRLWRPDRARANIWETADV